MIFRRRFNLIIHPNKTFVLGLVSWPSAFQAVAGTELVIECVMASQKGMPPTKAYLMLNDKSIPEQSQEYTVSFLSRFATRLNSQDVLLSLIPT